MPHTCSPLIESDCYRIAGSIHTDNRGSFCSPLRSDSPSLVQHSYDNVYVSYNTHKHTLRGFHYQNYPHGENKIVTALTGSALHVVIRLNADNTIDVCSNLLDSPSISTFLSSNCASAFLTLEPDTTILYLSDKEYVPSSSCGFRWDDPFINFNWGLDISELTISDRDISHPLISR